MSDVLHKLNSFAKQNNISPEMVNNLFSTINNSSNSSSQNHSNASKTSNSNDNNGIDFETIMKMKSIIDKINKQDDPRSKLLQSLKPYLNDSRKSKVDQYIQFMNMSKVMDAFPFMGGEKKK